MSRQDPVDTGPVPRLALTREEAAAAIGMSLDSFERHVPPSDRTGRESGVEGVRDLTGVCRIRDGLIASECV
jgi:hypothetical protein